MPFTFAHPAIVLPIKNKWKRYFDLTALALGSMSPDFEYFIRFKPIGTIGHNFLGFILLNLPLCFILFYIYHNVIKEPFICHMISPMDKWYSNVSKVKPKLNSFKKIIIFIYSCILGMYTHVFWDAFTHKNGEFVNLFPILDKKINLQGHFFPIYKVLQHGSTLLGIVIICIYLYKIKADHTSSYSSIPTNQKVFYHLFSFFIGIAFIGIAMLFNSINFSKKDVGTIVVTCLNGIFLGYIFSSLKISYSKKYL